MLSRSLRLPLLAAVLSCPVSSQAGIVFSDNFNTNTSANWTTNVAPAANASLQSATFAFDYSALGIPAAPGNSDTLGLRLRANIPGGAANPVTTRPGGVLSGLSVSPTGQSFGSVYQLRFHAWSNFNGTAANATGLADNGSSEGGTNNVLFAVGTAGNVPLVVGNTTPASGSTIDGIAFATTGDGGIANDYRAYLKSGTIAAANSGVYAAGTANDINGNSPLASTNLYYQGIPSLAPHSAPSVQQTISTAEYGSDANNTQQGQTQIGSFGFAWHEVVINKDGNTVTWDIDGTRIATANISAITLGGANIALGQSDVNTSTTRHPQLLFTVFDNVVVQDVVPEPASLSLLGLGAMGLLRRRRA